MKWCCSVVSDSLWSHGLQYARLPCPLISPGVCTNSYPLSQWCHPTISSSVTPSPFAFSLSQHQGLFQWVGSSHQVTKVLELQLQHQSSNKCSGLISFRIDWFDLPTVQGTLQSHLQHHSLKASVLWCSDFYMVQLTHLYMTTGKNHSFDYTDLCQQSDVSAFLIHCWGFLQLSFQGASIF